ncbi:PRD domain-containing protein [Mesobacillus foraminis]|uniref:PRD domain-containing protein n=1 Tax=Mesobacillus foraminis TaxID=279826 RepID=UPI001BE5AAAE|nr:PRD domain-containing protein [Mesobacillus foraminis]MBT2755569.1 PRD domain-containing protein [Mesobacillus foraminis]
MKLKKILNNNAVLVTDGDGEKVAFGAGIAYGKKKNDLIHYQKVEKLFVMKKNEKFQQLMSRIPEEHLIISEEIISYAEQYLGSKLSEHIHIALTDHVSFAIDRIKQGIHLENKLLNEIKILYRREYEIGLWAINRIKEKCDIEMTVDEAAYIALHIHTMKLQGGNYGSTIRQTTIIKDIVHIIIENLGIKLSGDDLSYQWLISHLRFVLSRVSHSEFPVMDKEMLGMIQKKIPLSYNCAINIEEKIYKLYELKLPETELGFIALHIERLRKKD